MFSRRKSLRNKDGTFSALRLADPAHPARKLLDNVANIMDKYVQVVVEGERTGMRVNAPAEELDKTLAKLEQAIAQCPNDIDLLVAKANVLYASSQFKAAEEILDMVLERESSHFEAKTWKNHWDTWLSAFRVPVWREKHHAILHPVMAAHLRHDHRVQVIRDGLQKTLAIVTQVQGPPFDRRTQAKTKWVLSETPYGLLVAYYLKIIEPAEEPSIMEAFLPIFKPALFSAMEGYFLVQQLAFAPYCFVVLVNDDDILFNRRVILGKKTVKQVQDIAEIISTSKEYLPQSQFKQAVQWHMNNFNMKNLTFE